MSQFREKSDYEVFLSFRGEDVRTTFISHLLNALQQRGIKTFYDDDRLPRGGDIQLELYRAIETSRLSLVTFSPKYATSRWCLDELVKIMELKRSHRHVLLPVFYGVHPSNVRYQSGPYKKAFEEHKVRFRHELDKVDEWRQALKSAADLAGFSFQYKDNGSEAELIKHIVSEVLKKLGSRQLSVPKYLVGGEQLVKKICAWLQNGSSEVQMGILYGPGGVGKTTTAKVAYNGHFHSFECSSFLAGIRSASGTENDFIHLQEQLVSNISGNDTVKIHNVHEGREKIRKVTGSKKVFIVLDDVEDENQLVAMFDYPDWFFPGSKVLITTRNKRLGKYNFASTVLFQVLPLSFENSADLFCHQAFRQSHPPQEYIQISNLFIEYCGGLPLALEVLGSSLRNEALEIWKCQYVKLKEFPNQRVQSILKMSFDSLEDNDRDIFLRIAFFMVGMKKSFVVEILKGCCLHAKIGLNNLIDKVLVSVDECGDTLVMHNLIQQMAFEVVRLEAPSEPGQRSRLFFHKDITGVMCKNTGTSKLKGLRLDLPDLISSEETFQSTINSSLATSSLVSPSRSISHRLTPIKTSAFSKMDNLDILMLGNVQLEGDFQEFPKMIKCLVWQGCQLQCIPSNFELDKLVLLDMQKSCLVQAWKGSKYMGSLKVLDLSYSQQLECTPDLSSALNLEFLSLECCQSLVRMHESVRNLRSLTTLTLKGCQRLESLSIPHSVVELNLDGCGNFFKVPNETETDKGEFAVFGVTIENLNLTRKWEWLYDLSLFGEGTFDEGSDVTWLSHLCVREGRDVQSGDMLKISINTRIDFEKSVKWGANMLYEEHGAAGEGNTVQDDSCNCQDNWSTNSKTSWEDQDVKEEDRDASLWYDDIFRSAL